MTDGNGDHFAAVQGHDHRGVVCSDRDAIFVGDGRGICDRAVLAHRWGSSQLHGGGVVDIGNRSVHRSLDRVDRFEVATGRVLDGFGDGGRALVDVVADRDRQGAGALTDGDGDHFAAVQRDGDRRVVRGDRGAVLVGQGRGVSDGAVFIHARGGG
ncbi:hypothetical protein D3C72_1376820 [compost metagenome]